MSGLKTSGFALNKLYINVSDMIFSFPVGAVRAGIDEATSVIKANRPRVRYFNEKVIRLKDRIPPDLSF